MAGLFEDSNLITKGAYGEHAHELIETLSYTRILPTRKKSNKPGKLEMIPSEQIIESLKIEMEAMGYTKVDYVAVTTHDIYHKAGRLERNEDSQKT